MIQLGALQSAVTGPGSQTQYLSACRVMPGTSFRSPEGKAKSIWEPAGLHRELADVPGRRKTDKVAACCALAAVAKPTGAATAKRFD